jgi:hypothetical protein
MKTSTKIIFFFGLIIGVIWSVAWSIQDDQLNVWPLVGMFIVPNIFIGIVSLFKGKSQW